MSRSSTVILMILLGISIVGFFILNLLLGSVHIPFDEIIGILLGRNDGNVIWTNIILKSRLPQSLTAMMAGAGLAVSGLLMQTVFRLYSASVPVPVLVWLVLSFCQEALVVLP